jgi:hypothetical protein
MAFAIFFPAFFALVVVSMKPAMLSGYSSLRLAMAVPGVRVVTIDVAGCPTVVKDAVHVAGQGPYEQC